MEVVISDVHRCASDESAGSSCRREAPQCLVQESRRPGRGRCASAFCYVGNSISRRLIIIKVQLVLLFVLCAVIMVTAVLTWRLSMKATEKSINQMSAQLREDVTRCAVSQLRDLLTATAISTKSLSAVLHSQIQSFSREAMGSSVLSLLWTTFSAYENATATYVMSAEGLVVGYRRTGPEVALLNSPMAVAIPAPLSDPLSLNYAYIPDNVTGMPRYDGPLVKQCAIGSCPDPLDRTVYTAPLIPVLSSPVWLVGRSLPAAKLSIVTSIGNVEEPVISMIASLKNHAGTTSAVLAIVFSARKLQPFLQSSSPVQRYKGRMFISVGKDINILSASHGPLFTPPTDPTHPTLARPSFLSAMQSSDYVISGAARFLNSTFGEQIFMSSITTETVLGQGYGMYYINSMPLMFEGLKLLVTLAVPRDEFRGEIEHSRRYGLIITMIIVIVMFVVGGLAMCMSTTVVSRRLSDQEKGLDEAAATNKALAQELSRLTSTGVSTWPEVDMGTPLEKVRTILKGLTPGHVLTRSQLQQLQELITADDLHRPQFLASMQSSAGMDVFQSRTSRGKIQVDRETGQWIEIIATGRRSPTDRPSRRSTLSHTGMSPGVNWEGRMSRLGASLSINLPVSAQDSQDGLDYLPLPGALKAVRGLSLVGRRSLSMDHVSTRSSSLGSVSSEALLWDLAGDRAPPDGDGTGHPDPDPPPAGDAADADEVSVKSIRLYSAAVQMGPGVDPQTFEQLQRVVLAAVPVTGHPEVDSTHAGGAHRNGLGDSGSASPHPETSLLHGLRASADVQAPESHRRLWSASRVAKKYKGPARDGTSQGKGGGQGGDSRTRNIVPLTVTVDGGDGDGALPGGISGEDGQNVEIRLLRKLGSWEFDTLALAAAVGDQLLPLVGYSMFFRMGLIQEYGLPKHKLMNFLYQVSRGMGDHPYHNAIHVSDVSASLFHLLTQGGVGDHLCAIDKLAALCAALIHDYKHPGVNNDFLNRTREDLATIYNDQSPLENFHLAEAFHLLYTNEHCNFLKVLTTSQFVEFRRTVIAMVLATDLKQHFVTMDQFKARISQNTPWDANKDSDRALLLQISLKIADIGHSAKPLATHLEWSSRVTEEFYKQGDLEMAANLAVSPFMDRHTNNMPKSQVRPARSPICLYTNGFRTLIIMCTTCTLS
eukprot:jgi/Mesvir1/15800/Mv03361-RA.2